MKSCLADREEKKKWLQNYQSAKRRISLLDERIQRCRSAMERITPVLSDMPKGGGGEGNKVERGTEQLVEYEAQRAELVEMQNKIEFEIFGLDDARHCELLDRVYIRGESIREAAENMRYSNIWGKKAHIEAIDSINI